MSSSHLCGRVPGGGGGGGTWVLNRYPLPNGHAERKQSMSNIRSGEPPLFKKYGAVNYKLRTYYNF